MNYSLFQSQFLFEWRFFTRQPAFYVISLIFFSMALLAPLLPLPHTSNTFVNGAYASTSYILGFVTFSLILVVNFIANSALRDHDTNMAEIIYCKPLNPLAYQSGRFLGSYAVVMATFSLVPIGLALGSVML
ncbi:MAG: hypothetical protein MJK04_23920 [Psychrosphaera sp.]|nr:hypothetical protein [Psychrosphaera sp.]